ncbi:tape measure protein [Halomonas litopenaei]|uniref:tape measure protein n=1 Tax=Halomonas litopenaei TaxID=2109328 RepID=UPI003FA13CC0
MSKKIASLYADLSYRVDYKGLRQFQKSLESANKKVREYEKKLHDNTTKRTKGQIAGLVAIEKRLNSQRGKLYQLRQDYMKINREYHAGNVSLERRNRLLGEMNTRMRSLRKASVEANTAFNHVRSGGASSVAAGRSGIGHSRAATMGATMGGAARMMSGPAMAGAAAAVGTGMAMYSSNEAYQRLESVRASFTALEGSVQGANERLKDLYGVAQYFGQSFMGVAEGYRSWSNALKGSSVEGQAMEMFTQMTAWATSMGLSQDRVASVQLALGQIAANDILQSQEVNQLTEHGVSRQMLAESLGMTIPQLMNQMEAGAISAQKLLPSLMDLMVSRANVGGALDNRRTSTAAEQQRAGNVAFFSNATVNKHGLDSAMRSIYTGMQESLGNMNKFFEELGELFDYLGPIARDRLNAFGNLLNSIGNLSDSFDGIDFENPLMNTADVMNDISTWVNRVADIIGTIRSDTSWESKVSGISDILVDHLRDIAERFINGVINKINYVLPSAMELSHVRFGPSSGSLSADMLMLSPDTIQGLSNNMDRARQAIAPMLNTQGGISDPNQVPFGPPVDRNGHPMNGTTNVYHQNISPTLEINGAQDVESIKYEIGHYLDQVIRTTSMSQPKTER